MSSVLMLISRFVIKTLSLSQNGRLWQPGDTTQPGDKVENYNGAPEARRRTYVKSRDFNDRVHVLFLEILCDSGKTLFDISVNTGQICMRFEANTPQKLLKYAQLTKFPDKKLI